MHRIIVNCETGEVSQVEYTAEEQAAYDAAIAAQAAEEQAEYDAAIAAQVVEEPVAEEP
jgi:predicted Fe-Mo cluster-binding NifX family protein